MDTAVAFSVGVWVGEGDGLAVGVELGAGRAVAVLLGQYVGVGITNVKEALA